MDQAAFERGQQQAKKALARWQRTRFRSPEAYRRSLLQTGPVSSRWEHEVSWQQGFLSGLAEDRS
jgi:hypothetical protein